MPEECPNCGAAVEQAVASLQDNPHCDYCREPIPVQPLAVQQPAGAGQQQGYPGFPGQLGSPGQTWSPNGGWSGPGGYRYPWSRGRAGRYGGRSRARVAVLPVIIAGVVAIIAISSVASKLTHNAGPAGVATPSIGVTAPTAAGGAPAAQFSLVIPPPSAAGALIRDRGAETAAFRGQAAAARRHMVLATSSAAAVYRQPHHLDRQTGKPALVDYFGFELSVPAAADANLIPAYRVAIAPTYTAGSSQSVAAGPGGGAASCSAGATFGGSQVTMCVWVASGTVGALEAPTRDESISQLAALMRQMRPALERR